MSRYFPTDEQYDKALDEAKFRHRDRILVSLQIGCAHTLRQIDMALGDYMQDTQAWMDVITKTAAGENPLQKVLAELVLTEAEACARAELAQREQRIPQNIAEDRAENRAWDRLMAFENAYG